MDSNSSEYLLNHATTLPSVYYQTNNKENGNFIDLGLSLRALQPEAYYPSTHGMFMFSSFIYEDYSLINFLVPFDIWYMYHSSTNSDLRHIRRI